MRKIKQLMFLVRLVQGLAHRTNIIANDVDARSTEFQEYPANIAHFLQIRLRAFALPDFDVHDRKKVVEIAETIHQQRYRGLRSRASASEMHTLCGIFLSDCLRPNARFEPVGSLHPRAIVHAPHQAGALLLSLQRDNHPA